MSQGNGRFGLGLQIEAPVTFRLFDLDAAVVPTYRYSLTGDTPATNTTGPSFRLNV